MDSIYKHLITASVFLFTASALSVQDTDNSNLARINNFEVHEGQEYLQVFLACHRKRPATEKDVYQLAKYYPPGQHKIVLKATRSIDQIGVEQEAYLISSVDFKQGHEYDIKGVFDKNNVDIQLVDKKTGTVEKLQTVELKPHHKIPSNQTFKLCRESTV